MISKEKRLDVGQLLFALLDFPSCFFATRCFEIVFFREFLHSFLPDPDFPAASANSAVERILLSFVFVRGLCG